MMTTRKKIITLALSVVLIVFAMATLVACTGKDAGAPYNIIISNNDDMALGAVAALGDQASGIPIIGVDATTPAVEAIKNGKMYGTVKQEVAGMADAILDIASNFLSARKDDPTINIIDSLENTKWNGDKYKDVDVTVGVDEYNYKAKPNKVRLPYTEFDINDDTVENFPNKTLDGTVQVVLYSDTDAFINTVATAMQNQSSGALNTDRFIKGDGKDQANQTTKIEAALVEKPDLLIVNLVDPKATDDVVKKCDAANVPVIFFNKEDRDFDYKGHNTLYIGSDLDGGGHIQGEMVANLLKEGPFKVESGTVIRPLILYGQQDHADALYRTLSWITFANKGLEGTGIKIDFEQKINGNVNVIHPETDWNLGAAQKLVEGLMTSPGFKSIKK
ncbi:MAG: substrate-binding domain-containing protein [Firmicutes bacterium]|nr:substrate-binding domain-containing protein [Bacillota bacterium]